MRSSYVFILALSLLVLMPRWERPAQAAGKSSPPLFAFWYEDWRPDSWAKLQPANVIIGVPPKAVDEIHAHGGRALAYVTFYQSKFGTVFLRDRADLENVGFRTSEGFLPSAFGGKDNFVLCSNSTELARRVLAYVDQTLGRDHFDGLFIDNAYLPPAADDICDAKHQHIVPGARGGSAYVHLLSLITEAAHRRNATIIVNAGNPRVADGLKIEKQSLWDVADYIVWESYGYSSHVGGDHDRWPATIAQSMALASSPHARQVLALSYPRDRAEALFSFALARAFGFAYSANLGEADLKSEREGGHFGVFLHELPTDLGAAESALQAVQGATVLERRFNNGDVVVNTGSKTWSFKARESGTVYDFSHRSPVRSGTRVEVPARSAVVLVQH